jgi:DNA polymerase-3 subunit epsilon
MSSVSRNIVMLVSDGSMDGTKAACAAELVTRVVHPDEYEVLLKNVRPAGPIWPADLPPVVVTAR